MKRDALPHTPEFCGLLRLDGATVRSYRIASESFDGEPEFHYFTVGSGSPVFMDCAIHEKTVPLNADEGAVAWTRVQSELEC